MKNTEMKINCWEFKEENEVPMPSTTTLDGFEWNGKFRITVSNDDASLGLPFLFAADDTAIMTVEKAEQKGTHSGNKKIKQILRCVPRSLGNEIVCCRTRSYNGEEHVWSEWELSTSGTGTAIKWDATSRIDNFVTAGVYNITGERLEATDGLPIDNNSPGHTVSARLTVLDSSISGTGNSDDKCVTQILSLSNRTGGDGDIYIRTGRALSKNQLVGGNGWESWSMLQQNVQVGQVTSLNGFTGNGMYSGVYTDGSTFFETFVLVVINNYAVAGKTGNVRSISQFKYALNVDGTFTYKTRIGQGGTDIYWGNWVDLGAASTTDIQDGAITAQKLSSDIRSNAVSPLRPLFIAAGAVYNSTSGFYELNGINDLTENDIMISYIYKDVIYHLNMPRVLQGVPIRTIYSFVGHKNARDVFNNVSGLCTFTSTKLENLRLANISIDTTDNAEIPQTSNIKWDATFMNCYTLREVWPINVSRVPSFSSNTFKECVSLTELRLFAVSNGIVLDYSANISKTSILYIVSNATPTTAITITLHPDAYARLADDADIVAALEAQPLVSLVSA